MLKHVSLSIIVPTTGRDTLDRTLDSIDSQPLLPGDQLIVSRDVPPHGDAGCWARNRALDIANCDGIVFIDDDDVFLPGAFEHARRAILDDPDSVHIFRMSRGKPFNDVLWREKDLSKPGDVSTQMFVVPNSPGKVGRWTPRYEGDYDFIFDTARRFGSVVWHEEIISRWRP